jgi:hypothetical protein
MFRSVASDCSPQPTASLSFRGENGGGPARLSSLAQRSGAGEGDRPKGGGGGARVILSRLPALSSESAPTTTRSLSSGRPSAGSMVPFPRIAGKDRPAATPRHNDDQSHTTASRSGTGSPRETHRMLWIICCTELANTSTAMAARCGVTVRLSIGCSNGLSGGNGSIS